MVLGLRPLSSAAPSSPLLSHLTCVPHAMAWRLRSALPPQKACFHGVPMFPLCFPTTSSTHSLSLRFASLTSLHESGRFDAPFSHNELVAALYKCHESAGCGLPPAIALQGLFPMVASSSALFLQPCLALRCSVSREFQPPGHQARWWSHFS